MISLEAVMVFGLGFTRPQTLAPLVEILITSFYYGYEKVL